MYSTRLITFILCKIYDSTLYIVTLIVYIFNKNIILGNKKIMGLKHNMNNNNSLDVIYIDISDRMRKFSSTKEKMEYLSTALYDSFEHYFWVGFYYPNENEMTIGPSAGPPACASIGYEGVCGAAYKSGKSVIVPNVEEFPGHITCDPHSKSEVVVPVKNSNDKIIALLDVDSDHLGAFNDSDALFLEKLVSELFA